MLGLDSDEGPFFQRQRYPGYREVIQQWLAEVKAYRCYRSKNELQATRAAQPARKEKPRYNGRCHDHSATPDGTAAARILCRG